MEVLKTGDHVVTLNGRPVPFGKSYGIMAAHGSFTKAMASARKSDTVEWLHGCGMCRETVTVGRFTKATGLLPWPNGHACGAA